LRTPGPAATEQLVAAASQQLAPGCSVLVFPIVTYPVDFTIGVESYVGYDTLKPGLVDSDLKWTPGSLPGTPNAAWNEALVQLYRSHDYTGAIGLAEQHGACGALLMSSLQDVIATASGTTGTPHGAAADIRGALQQEYGAACYTDADAAVELYCGTAGTTRG